MASRKNTAPAGARPQTEISAARPASRITKPLTFGTALADLFNAARDHLGADDLKRLSEGLSDSARLLAQNMSAHCESVACLLGAAGSDDGMVTDDDTSEFLFMLGTMADLIGSAIFVASDSEGRPDVGQRPHPGRFSAPGALEEAAPEGSA